MSLLHAKGYIPLFLFELFEYFVSFFLITCANDDEADRDISIAFGHDDLSLGISLMHHSFLIETYFCLFLKSLFAHDAF